MSDVFLTATDELAERLQRVDGYALFIGGMVAYFVGNIMSQGWPEFQQQVLRMGVVCFGVLFAVLFFHVRNGEYLAVAFKAALFALTITGLIWTFGPVFFLLHRLLIRGPKQAIERFGASLMANRNAAADRQREAQQSAQRAEQLDREQQAAEQRLFQEQQRKLAAEQLALMQKAETQRRAVSRAECERHYMLHEAEIGHRFPRAHFIDYLKRHLGDDHSADYVEAQAEKLKQLIEAHRVKVEPPNKLPTIGDIGQWFEVQKTQIEQVTDEKLRRLLLVQLKVKYAELTSKMMDEIE